MMAESILVVMKTRLLALSVISLALVSTPTFAAETKLSNSQSITISESCSSIRQKLKNIQRTDSRTRTYFGAIYETVSSKFLKPLNLRLVNNDLANSTTLELQTSLVDARVAFSDDFISYSKSLEELITIDCRLEPETFYQKLLETRKKRATVASDVKKLNELLINVVKNTEKLKESLK